MEDHPFDRVTLAELRTRKSAKWAVYPSDVLPAWVAEMDFPLAAPIARALTEAIARNDVGYPSTAGLGEAFAAWAKKEWSWDVAPRDVRLVSDVVTGISEILRVATAPGDGVLIDSPVYARFAGVIRANGRSVIDAPLIREERNQGKFRLNLEAIERAYAGGAKAHVLCSPHNPTGIVIPRDTLAEIARLAEKYDVLVLSDEIHAPLTHPGSTHVPFPTVSDAAKTRGIVLTSASKTWNIAGLKAALMIAETDRTRAVLARLPAETPYHAGHFGVLASIAAFTEGDAWRTEARAIIDRNRVRLAELIRAEIPGISYTPPEAGYLAWLDCAALGLGDDPARAFLDRGRVALSPGLTFGNDGAGFARLNIGTTRALLEESVRRIARATQK